MKAPKVREFWLCVDRKTIVANQNHEEAEDYRRYVNPRADVVRVREVVTEGGVLEELEQWLLDIDAQYDTVINNLTPFGQGKMAALRIVSRKISELKGK